MLYLVWKKKKKYFYVIINLESETKIETTFQSTYGGNGLVVHVFFIPARGSYMNQCEASD